MFSEGKGKAGGNGTPRRRDAFACRMRVHALMQPTVAAFCHLPLAEPQNGLVASGTSCGASSC